MNDDCVKDAYKHAKVDQALIDGCMKDSGGLEKDASNAFLDLEISSQTERGVVVLPTAFFNTAAIRGSLSVNNVFTAICAGYSEGTTPTICAQCANCGDPASCITNKGKCTSGGGGSSNSDSVSKHTFLTSMFMVVALFSGLGFWHWKRTREEMRDQVRGILAEYMPLEDQGDGGSSAEGGMLGNPMDFAKRAGTASLISGYIMWKGGWRDILKHNTNKQTNKRKKQSIPPPNLSNLGIMEKVKDSCSRL